MPPGNFPIQTADPGTCSYCGAQLDPFFYFCIRCAKPYKTMPGLAAMPAPLSDSDRIKKMAPHTWTVFWTYLIVIILSALFSLLAFHEDPLAQYITSTIVIAATTCVLAIIHYRPLAPQFKTFGFNQPFAWIGIAVLPFLLGINYVWHELFIQLIRGFDDFHFHIQNLNTLSTPAKVILLCLFPAVAEEIAFRGLLQYWLEVALTPAKAILLAAALFSSLHFSVYSFFYLMLVGAVLGIVRHKTNSLYPCMLIHFLHNLVAVTLFAS